MESRSGDTPCGRAPDADDLPAGAGPCSQPSADHALGLSGGDERGPADLGQPPPAGPPLESAPRLLSLWDVMQRQVDRAFADFLNGDYPMPPPWWGEAGSGPGAP